MLEFLRQQKMPSATLPDFDGALARFRAFLKQNNYSENIVWVMPEDIVLTGKRLLYVRVPIPAENERRIRRIYDDGVAQGRGLVMGTVCRTNQSTYSYLWFPRSAEEIPQGIWPTNGDLKLSARDDSSSPAGRPIKHRVLWTFLKLWHYKKQSLSNLLFTEKGLITEVPEHSFSD